MIELNEALARAKAIEAARCTATLTGLADIGYTDDLLILLARENDARANDYRDLLTTIIGVVAPPPPPPPPPPPVGPPPPGARPTLGNTGPTIGLPAQRGDLVVNAGESITITNEVIGSVKVNDGGRLTLDRCDVTGTIVVLPGVAGQTKLHMNKCSVLGGITINAVDGQGNLYWGSEVPVDLAVDNTYVYYPQGDYANGDHTEALASFGWIKGGRFFNCAFVQQGPNNQTATATMNWHGAGTVFDTCWFDFQGGVASYFTLYCEGPGNVIRNSFIAPTGSPNGYVYPDSDPPASFEGCKDLTSGQPLTLP